MIKERAVVFVVDDDPSMRLALEDLVGTVGLEVRTFAAPQEFLQSKPSDAFVGSSRLRLAKLAGGVSCPRVSVWAGLLTTVL